MSRWGFAVLDDSRTLLFDDDGWVAPRDGSRTDLYFFGYGHDYREASRRSTRSPAPRRCCPGSRSATGGAGTTGTRADEYVALIDRFARRGHPVLRRGARHGLAPRRHRPGATAAAGPATPGTATCSPTRRRSWPWLHEHGLRVTPERAPGRRRARARGGLPGDGRARSASTRRRRADRLRRHRSGRSSTPTSTCCTARWRTTASTSGGSTGSPARTPGSPASTRCGCSTTSTSWTARATASRAR